MQVVVQSHWRFPSADGPSAVILIPNSWDDFGYRTSYDLWVRTHDNHQPTEIGRVKVAHANQEPGPSPLLPGTYPSLLSVEDGRWFSVGQEDVYYEKIRKLGALSTVVYGLLNDLAFTSNRETLPQWSGERLDTAGSYQVTAVSLLRSVNEQTVRGQFYRITTGGPRLTRYQFDFTPEQGASPLEFRVRPHSNPPSNIHVIIGRNGVGKTRLLQNLAQAVAHPERPENVGSVDFIPSGYAADDHGFVNVVSVTFSAFDRLNQVALPGARAAAATHVHVGLQWGAPGGMEDGLVRIFIKSLKEVLASQQVTLWFRCFAVLARDRHFAEIPVQRLAVEWMTSDIEGKEVKEHELGASFGELSSGHAIALLTITKLVEHVAERSIVLIDEPESHLHPPLLSSLIRTISFLLAERNGFALIATHSPVVLQEVPRSCVFKLSRNGNVLKARPPRIETYGENVGVLTHEIFGLEVMESGFYSELSKAVEVFETYEEVLEYFGRQLGDEARLLVQILLTEKGNEGK
ncbi:AAA family ATPase [Streptomyces hydrogenans]|uniref:AAA family ATPase n=1 Tax=Streptomyces hydrogenans TaxID=1873719 RepID=UPI003D7361FE